MCVCLYLSTFFFLHIFKTSHSPLTHSHCVVPPSSRARRSFSNDAKDIIRRLLTADRTKRLGSARGGASDVKDHPWFSPLGSGPSQNWDSVLRLEVTPPFVPKVRDSSDTSNFDKYPDSDGETAKALSPSENVFFQELDAL